MLQVRLGDQAFDLDTADGNVTLNGQPVDVRLERLNPTTVLLVLDGQPHVLTIEQGNGTATVTRGGQRMDVEFKDETALLLEAFGFDEADGAAEREVRAPMPGLVLRVLVEPGEAVEEGQGLVVLEAMKMENELRAPAAGTIATVHAEPGAAVGKNDLLIELG
ncbi:MAG: biotin/lipoyl-binding protein [Rhodothermaceae bacterium]|nr:biotin/lipoyl-binding protein [Rhodothermaceae bacterium]